MATVADIASLFSDTEDWDIPHRGQSKLPTADYLGGHMLDHATLHGHYSFMSDPEQSNITNLLSEDAAGPTNAFRDPGYFYGALGEGSLPLHLGASDLVSLKGGFTAMNSLTDYSHNKNTIAPLQTCVDSAFETTPSFSTEDSAQSATSSKLDFWGDMYPDSPPFKRRRNSSRASSDVGSPKQSNGPGRRRKSENVELGSARAIYLEKNRQAASKCRNKQKLQQEELVETGREVERKNKVLKAEVEYLKRDMRELMEIVDRHAGCPDKRLHTYVQREADRLAARRPGGGQSPVRELLSPKESASPGSQQ